MVRFTHPEMLYNFILLFFLLAIYYIKHIRLNNRLKQKLGSKSVTSFLLNRLKVNSTLLRSYLIFLGFIFGKSDRIDKPKATVLPEPV